MSAKCSVICPLFKAEKYIDLLVESLLIQEDVSIVEVLLVLTDTDGDERRMIEKWQEKDKRIKLDVITEKEFSHSLTREKVAMKAKGDILVFVTQDVEIRDKKWLAKLVAPIENGEADATYSRQKTKYNNIEKYTRESNYGEKSFVVTKEDIPKYGLKTFFFSDAASAILKSKFIELGGYDGKKLPISEDMYFAYKLIMNSGKIKYCADSVVYHSHKFSLKQIYDRYKLTGKFFKENSYLDQYGTNNSGAKMAKHVLKRILQEKRFMLLLRYPFDMGARLVGMRIGKK